MARLPRLYAPSVPHLVQASFALPLHVAGEEGGETLDRITGWLADEARVHEVAIHGWTLTSTCLALLGTPAGPKSWPGLMQSLGRRIAAQTRAGRVFSSRYRSTLIEPGAWVMPALVWVESLPLRQALVADLEHWSWSSARAHIGAGTCPFLTDHADYWAYGNTPFDRQAGHRRFLLEGLGQKQHASIEGALRGQWALGSEAFLFSLEQSNVSRRPTAAKRGRPKKSDVSPI